MKSKAVVLFCLLLLPTSALADSFKFTYYSLSQPGVSATGIITAMPTGNFDEYLITGIIGERNNAPIVSFAAGGPNPFYYKDTYDDNLLYMPSGALSYTGNSGFVFGTADGEFNIWLNTDRKYYEYMLGGGEGNPGIQISFNVSDPPSNSIPEPAAPLLLGLGLAGLAAIRIKINNQLLWRA